MKHRRNKIAGVALVMLMGFLLLSASLMAYAAETGDSQETEGLSKSKTSSEYELSATNDTTEITLSLPSEEYLDTFDIVFVVDSSNESQLWEPEAVELMDALLGENLNMNIGVVKFKGRAQDTIDAVSGGSYSGLTALSGDTKTYIEEAIEFDPDTDARSKCGNGTNIHSALLLAEQWLDKSSTPEDHKYVLLFTDGRAYIYDDGNGNPTAIYAQYHRNGITINRLQGLGRPTINSQAQADKYHATISQGSYGLKDPALQEAFDAAVVRFGTSATHSAADFNLLYNSTNAELTGASPYETFCLYPDSGAAKIGYLGSPDAATMYGGTAGIPEWSIYFKSGATLFKNYYVPVGVPEGVPYLELSPLKAVYDAGADTYSYTGELNPNYWMFHVSSEEKALYLAAHTWTDLGGKYHTIAIPNDRGYNAGLETCKDFLEWLPENSELSAPVKDTAAVEALFDTLENQLIYAVGKAVVTDEIPSYLDLVEDAYSGVPFQVTVGGEVQTVTTISDNDWGFGTPDNGSYRYEVKWDASARTFTFNINVPVENANAVVLKYQLKWNGTGEEEVDVDTNASTTIKYWSSDDPQGDPTEESYVSPKVIYHSTTDYKVTKEWDDNNDADGIRPSSVKVQLYADGTEVGDPVTLDSSNEWTHTWKDLRKNTSGTDTDETQGNRLQANVVADGAAGSGLRATNLESSNGPIDYEVKEVSVPEGYTEKVVEDQSGYAATVTNTHKPGPGQYKVTVTPDPEDGGTVGGAGTFSDGETATVTAKAAEGYTFVNWTEDGEVVSTSATFSFKVTRKHELVAHFEAKPVPPKKCKVIFDPNGGLINGEPDNYVIETTVGTVITIIGAPTRSGYTFKYWKGSEYHPGEKYTVPGDHIFVAQWEKTSNSNTGKSTTTTTKGSTAKTSDELPIQVVGLIALLSVGMILVAGLALRRSRQ